MQDEVTVTQADREALGAIDDALGFLMDNEREIVLAALARHRHQAERGEVVGYIIPEMLNRKSEFERNGIVMTAVPQGMSTLPLYAARPVQSELVEALEDARRIIADIDDYMKRPGRGDWGEECACCMGELLDDDREAIARIDTTLAALKETDNG